MGIVFKVLFVLLIVGLAGMALCHLAMALIQILEWIIAIVNWVCKILPKPECQNKKTAREFYLKTLSDSQGSRR